MTQEHTQEAAERLRFAFHKTRVGPHINVVASDVGCLLDYTEALAARVRELEAAADGDALTVAHLKGYADGRRAAEAKLAKALELIALCRKMQAQVAHSEDPLMLLIDNTTAELKGEKDE
jgi:hypothetical protein